MQVLVLSGSRNPEGRTARLINAMPQGITKAGGNSELLFLPQMKIERCRQCNADGWGICRSEHQCIIKDDDFDSILEKVKKADAVVFATPVYFADLSESLRAFLDRLRRTRFMIGPRGMPPVPTEQMTPAVGLCYAGGSGNGTTNCAMNLERILQTCGFDVVDVIPARRQNLEAKLPIMELTGQWLVTKPSSLKSNLQPM
jgi:NAD(P)H-dependent FMN reductase